MFESVAEVSLVCTPARSEQPRSTSPDTSARAPAASRFARSSPRSKPIGPWQANSASKVLTDNGFRSSGRRTNTLPDCRSPCSRACCTVRNRSFIWMAPSTQSASACSASTTVGDEGAQPIGDSGMIAAGVQVDTQHGMV